MPRTYSGNLRFLVPSEFEALLRRRKEKYTKGPAGWSDRIKKDGLFFDLSRVEWVDLGAVVHLVLLVEAALRDEIKVAVALPLSRPRRLEQTWMRESASPHVVDVTLKRVERRDAANRFLKYLRFEEALACRHLDLPRSSLSILDNYDLSSDSGEPDEDLPADETSHYYEEIEPQTERLYQYFVPLTWASTKQMPNLREIATFLAAIIGAPKKGLERMDANTLANVILYELVDNVASHAESSNWALVAASAVSGSRIFRPGDYLTSERPYVEWFGQLATSSVDIVVGDSGIGIANKLGLVQNFREAQKRGFKVPQAGPNETSNLMMWAFDRWSSSVRDRSNDSGTRGLYRVDRIVKKYQGLVTIRSEKQLVGWDHGGLSYDKQIYNHERLGTIPGTVMRLRMPSFHEGYLPWRSGSTGSDRPVFEIIKLDPLVADGIDRRSQNRLRLVLNKAGTNDRLCVLAVFQRGQNEDLDGSTASLYPAVELAIKQAAELRHPGALVIYGLPGGWELIENAIDSVNSEHAKRRLDVESHQLENPEVWDPVLIIGERWQYAWAGVSESLKLVLDALLREGGSLTSDKLEKLFPDQGTRESIIRQLRNDTNMVRFLDNRKVEMTFAITDLMSHVPNQLLSHINGPRPSGVLFGKVFRTPSLLYVNRWLNVTTLVNDVCGLELSMAALSALIRESAPWREHGAADMIVSDTSLHADQMEILGSSLGITSTESLTIESEGPIPREVHLIARNSKVLVFTDIILSCESVRNCLRQIIRDGAIPIAVACLFDARQEQNVPVTLWETSVPVINLCNIDIGVAENCNNKKYVSNINPITKEEERGRTLVEISDYRVPPETLKGLVEEYGALHFSHIGREIGRHFTFFLDATKFINDGLIIDSLNAEIDAWIDHDRSFVPMGPSDQLELWHPDPEPKPVSPAKEFVEKIRSERLDVVNVRMVRRESVQDRWMFSEIHGTRVTVPNVVIIDWGALTGSSISQMLRLAAEAGASNILACVILSQMPIEEEYFIKSLNTLKIAFNEDQTVSEGQSVFPGFETEFEYAKQYRIPNVTVKFISRFPVAVYDRYDCPICLQLVRMSSEEPESPTDLIKKFIQDQELIRLVLRKRSQVVETPPEDFDKRRVSPGDVIKMSDFRSLLVEAISSTEQRHEVLSKIEAISEAMAERNTHSLETHLWILHFLAVETQWLKKPPLHFKRLRELIANISLTVALDNEIDESHRLNAIIVLRVSSKYLFARNLREVFEKVADRQKLVEQLLYGIFTYASRHYHQTSGVLTPIKNGLVKVKDSIGNNQILVSSSVTETVDRLLARVDRIDATIKARTLDTPNAWQMLREAFEPIVNIPHNPLRRNMFQMQPELVRKDMEAAISAFSKTKRRDGADNERVKIWLRYLETCWEQCCTFIDSTVLPLVGQIRHILNSDDGKLNVGPEITNKLLYLCDSKVFLAESDFTNLIKNASRDPHAMLSSQNWTMYTTEAEWYWKHIFRGGPTATPSLLSKFLMSAPADVGKVLKKVVDEKHLYRPELRIEGLEGLENSRALVFCTEELLREVYLQAIDNVYKHRHSKESSPIIGIETHDNDGMIQLNIHNTLTKEKELEAQGQAISLLRKRLESFGASIRANPRTTNDRWSFTLELTFKRGI